MEFRTSPPVQPPLSGRAPRVARSGQPKRPDPKARSAPPPPSGVTVVIPSVPPGVRFVAIWARTVSRRGSGTVEEASKHRRAEIVEPSHVHCQRPPSPPAIEPTPL